ncbi:peptidoglycan DD-metalloendopeptidase family protein [Acinetobacter haemolyticus]|uniref:peptidoglycan DD-metalloendopeptidase family protein n=1 Tax=Acinetobacter haemolyticus TaxID=29430 RepID=UPI000E581FC1|nr:peptidoglycan DD-metalloendopeptidase family protein [Acinetobacter haemolyticus]NAR57671.1 peptidoglycan DD-metalloendopeptidase family protein [Acinetobacter haemolyticus]NAR78990.1 peptidoglycan DD-metalloendopeptidase family protein [Acinetobacter haemolyticus]NAR90310.1 peptidoglycan DD-metalloendopeptidase family protein [Acinetobacter haemolyticus]NAR96406.1 peptidoglycan DD-metalloendopeptidase family protein [Acinetobacter haemolyticus]QDJ91831.1 LysM peptidoglycan-binding domain-c
MHLNHVSIFQSKKMVKTIVLSVAVVTAAIVSGCASKPQVSGGGASHVNAPNYYTVRSGDTLSGIANRYGMNYLDIAALNDIAPPYRIYVNQSLRLKGSAAQRTTSTQAMNQAAPIQLQSINIPTQQQVAPPPVRPVTPTQQRPVVPVTPPSTLASGLRWVKPSNGPVIQGFNLASNVKGTRYGGNVGDPVFAAANGQVVYAADGLKEYGNLVLVKHVDGYITAYAHNSKMLVKSGDNVTAGQKIAEMGSSGASRVMLEFQVRLDGKPINPTTVVPN